MKIYITRHGKTKWNEEGKIQGWCNSDLIDQGIENAKKLGKRLAPIDFDVIYSSPLGRALETAKHVRGKKDTPIMIKEDLKEMGFGVWEGKDFIEIQKEYREQYINLWEKPHLYQPIDGESYETLLARVGNVLNEIIENTAGENILIVTHAAVKKAIYALVKELSIENFWQDPFIHDTCLTLLEVKDGKWTFTMEADVSHLDEEIL